MKSKGKERKRRKVNSLSIPFHDITWVCGEKWGSLLSDGPLFSREVQEAARHFSLGAPLLPALIFQPLHLWEASWEKLRRYKLGDKLKRCLHLGHKIIPFAVPAPREFLAGIPWPREEPGSYLFHKPKAWFIFGFLGTHRWHKSRCRVEPPIRTFCYTSKLKEKRPDK